MKTTSIILLFTFLLLLTSFSRPEIRGKKPTASVPIFDTSVTAVIPYADSTCGSFLKGKAATLTSADIKKIELLLKKAVEQHNQIYSDSYYHLNLKEYKRQYVAVINENGEKIVWINCFCSDEGDYWKKFPLFVEDGGKCYFNLKINITKEKCYDFMVNGIA